MRRCLQSIPSRARYPERLHSLASEGEATCSLPASPETGASAPDLLAIQLLSEDWLWDGTGTGNPQGETLNPVWHWEEASSDV